MRNLIHRALAWLLVINVAIGGVVPADARTRLTVPGVTTSIGVGAGLSIPMVGVTNPGAGTGADAARLMFASTRTGWPQGKALPSDTQLARVSKTGFMTPDYTVNNLRPAFANFEIEANGAVSPETDSGNLLTLYRVSLLIGSTYYPVTFGGQQSGTIPDGGTLVADAVVIPGGIPPRTKAFWIVGDSVLSGQAQPGGLDRQSNNGETMGRAATFTDGWFDGTVSVPPNTNLGGTQTGRIYGPSVVLSTGWDGRGVVMALGDSMAAPANDLGNFTPDSGVQGWLARGLDSNASGTQRLPHANFAIAGTRPSGMSSRDAGKYLRRAQFIDALRAANAAAGKVGTDGKGLLPFTKILSEHINNDASGAPVTADLQNLMNAFWAFLRSEYPDAPIVQTAAMCATTSDSGQWTTLASQSYRTADTTAGTGSRWQVSDGYINSKPAVLDAVIDQTPLMMDVSLRKWSPRSYTGALAADYVAGALSVSLTTAPAIGEAIVVNAGTSGATKPTFVSAVSGAGPYTVTLFTSLVNLSAGTSQAITSGSSVAASAVADGLHASPRMHIELAAAIVAGKAAGKFDGPAGTGTAPSATVAPVNTALPTISGSTSLNSVLTAGSGTWSNSPTSYAYQWLRNGVAITGETGVMHIVSSADQGTTLTVRVIASNAAGASSPATSSGLAIPAATTASAKTMDSTTATMDSAVITMDAN